MWDGDRCRALDGEVLFGEVSSASRAPTDWGGRGVSVGAAVVIGVMGGILVLLVAEVVFHRAQIRWMEDEARDLRHRLDRLEGGS